MNKKRKVFIVILIILVTVLCIYLGNRTRYNNRIIITQLAGEGNCYIITTSENNLIIIDGGTENDSEYLAQKLKEKSDSKILAWFLTGAQNSKTGALCKILQNEPDIKIENIYISFNSGELYDNSDLTPEELQKLHQNLDILYSNENIGKLRETERRVSHKFDNYYVTALEVKNEDDLSLSTLANQTVILKVDNTFKNVIFLSDIGDEKAHFFLENDQDQFKCDVLQFSKSQLDVYGNEIIDKIKPETVFISDDTIPSYVKAENIYTKYLNKEVTSEIW